MFSYAGNVPGLKKIVPGMLFGINGGSVVRSKMLLCEVGAECVVLSGVGVLGARV